ncbi:hypothetical protein FNV43_RR07495 [Rhamnella rubrinervis]|uniref:Negative regulator of systemic acquired resistance SNI1 n=1 Tax=Rhamnella rubrinervis TaxID=2594499 RepID=A0A8K0MN17_9ROSA|nr:hypothetical protein FNV43_RR07495 [Rhamnella rubrinervis]
MELCRHSKINGGRLEENILAIVDASEARDTQDADDDRIAFLEAVRATAIVSESRTTPTHKMLQAAFKILSTGKSLELIMTSYQLLHELEKYFPRVYLSKVDESKSDSKDMTDLVVVKEAWSPFILNAEIASSERKAVTDVAGGLVDSSGFYLLIQDIAVVVDEKNFQTCDTKSLGKMLLFQYLVNILECDFLPRNRMYEETMDWILLRESLLNILLASRKLNCKSLLKDCLTIMCKLYQVCALFSDDLIYEENSVEKSARKCDTAVSTALPEVGKNTSIAIQKLITIIMELDKSKNKAEMQGCTTRADGVRTPVVEIILDELTYNTDILHPFLQVFDEPKSKLEVVVQYFWKYISKPSVRTRRSNGSADDTTFSGALKCFSNISSTKSIIRKIGIEEIQLLLVHGFEATLSLPSKQCSDESNSAGNQECRDSSLTEICKNLISAFRSLRSTEQHMEILSNAKEALFVAATILSMKS